MFKSISHLLLLLLTGFIIIGNSQPLRAQSFAPLVEQLTQKSFNKKIKVVRKIAASGESRTIPLLTALTEGKLYYRKNGKKVFITAAGENGFSLLDPLTGKAAGASATTEMKKIKINNKLRRTLNSLLGVLTLLSPDPATRLKSAKSVFQSRDIKTLPVLKKAIAAETLPHIKKAMLTTQAAIVAGSELPTADRLTAIRHLRDVGGNDVLALLIPLATDKSTDIATAAQVAIKAINNEQAVWGAFQNVIYGISLGSVLLLAAIGLAITFGVMGVINMAHGEMVMIGAYVTFMVQEAIRSAAPWLFDYSLLIALPLAFLTAGAIGFALERGLIRFLYGRPLETLLATWGVSLILQQATRTIFGPNNREVGNPSWMSGSTELGHLALTWNRLYIIVFALAVFAALSFIMRKTTFGLQMRAVVQNRQMAGSMGIRTKWVDALTFGLGSGIAGIAGVALSQIDNVSPNLGQAYIVDSFMVVVFGGVGNLWGTLVGAFSLGIANKFLEPYAGAVLGKILVLVFIILFIQKRPRGLFALKGRAVES